MPISRNRPPSAPSSPSPRIRFRSRILIAVLGALALLVLARTGLLDRGLGQLAPQQLNWSNDYQLVEHLRDEVVRRGLTHDAKDCLLFIINGNDPPDASRLEVMEKHSGSCPGARGQLPKLFTLKVDRLAHSVQTDAGSPGQFHPMP